MKDICWDPGAGGSSGTSNCKPQLKNPALQRPQTKQILILGWAPLCLVWQLINANVIQNTTGEGRKGWDSVLALLPELQTPMPLGCAADIGILLPNRAASGAGEAFLTPPIGDPPDESECGPWKSILKVRHSKELLWYLTRQCQFPFLGVALGLLKGITNDADYASLHQAQPQSCFIACEQLWDCEHERPASSSMDLIHHCWELDLLTTPVSALTLWLYRFIVWNDFLKVLLFLLILCQTGINCYELLRRTGLL